MIGGLFLALGNFFDEALAHAMTQYSAYFAIIVHQPLRKNMNEYNAYGNDILLPTHRWNILRR